MDKDISIKIFPSDSGHRFYKLINDNRSRLEDYFAGTLSCTRTLEDTIQYCKEIEKGIKDKNYFPYIIFHKETSEFIGLVDIKNIDWKIPKAEIGYFIDHRYEGKGIISEAVSFVIKTVVREYRFVKLLCRANAENLASIKVALRNSFELEGTIRRDYKTSSGEVVDLNYYGLLF